MSKEILHFDDQGKHIDFHFFLHRSIFLKKQKICSLCFYQVIETLVKVWENLNKLWKHLPAAHVSTAFFILPNFHLYFYNLIETQHMFSISLIKSHSLWVILYFGQCLFQSGLYISYFALQQYATSVQSLGLCFAAVKYQEDL